MKYIAQHKTAVVILSYNSVQWLEKFLPKVAEVALGNYDVYVVDHASSDNTSAFVSEHFPTVHVITFKQNFGFAGGYAEALKLITAKYYVLLSADFEVTDNWLQPLEDKMEANLQMAACQPKIRYYKDKEYFEYAGAAGGYMDVWGYLFCRGRIFDTLELDTGQYDNDIALAWASGGCLMVRAAHYHRVGGLDPDFFAHMEEVDLCWRMRNAGYLIGYVHNSTVFHVGGSVISYGSPQKTYYNFRNSFYLFFKNERASKLIWLIPLRLCLDGVAGVQFALKGQFKNVWSIVRAHFGFYAAIPSLIKKRKDARSLVKSPNMDGIFGKSLIVSYFIKKQKKFADLGIKTRKI